jgi:uncharacterized membrane protein
VVRPAVAELIRGETGSWDDRGWICFDDLQRFQHRYIAELVESEKGELTRLEEEVVASIRDSEILAQDTETEFSAHLSLGQRLADRIASLGGSWAFIIGFGAIITLWIMTNGWFLTARPFDPYPFILLNLILSCLAAIQAPVIMMSQNRQEARDRQRAQHDYQVNLKAELEIRNLHQKFDHLVTKQWGLLLEIQEVQMELLGEIRGKR